MMFLNSVSAGWFRSLLTVPQLLRVLVILKDPPAQPMLESLFSTQIQLPLE